MELTKNNTKNIHTTFSSLKTRAGAVARVEKVLGADSLDEFGTFNYTIAANEDGTFAPVVILRGNQKELAGSLAEKGIVVVG